ncbi:unnamed protein product [Lampetra planeri]
MASSWLDMGIRESVAEPALRCESIARRRFANIALRCGDELMNARGVERLRQSSTCLENRDALRAALKTRP